MFTILMFYIVLTKIRGKMRHISGVVVPVLIILTVVMTVCSIAEPKTVRNIGCFLVPGPGRFSTVAIITTVKRVFCSLSVTVKVLCACNSCVNGSISLRGSAARIRVFSATVTVLTKLVVVPTMFTFSNNGPSSLRTKPSLVFVALPGIFTDVKMKEMTKVLFFMLMLLTTTADTVSLLRADMSAFRSRLS